MSKLPNVLWLSTSPSLKFFDNPLLRELSAQATVRVWEYSQSQDEASSLDNAVCLLHDYLSSCNQPMHLIGHGTSGLLGLLYSRRYPQYVESLALLAVGTDAAIDWQWHYYTHCQSLSREKILNAMVYNLFGYQNERNVKKLECILERDLNCSLSPHSLFKKLSLTPESVPVRLMVSGSVDDVIVEPDALQAWEPYLKKSDRMWLCSKGRYFFHFFQPELVAKQVLDFWNEREELELSNYSLNKIRSFPI